MTALVTDYVTLRRKLGYRSPSQERALRAFARYLDQAGHDGPVPLEASLNWATSTASPDPCNPARRLTTVRGFLRHLSALDGATEVPAPGLLGPVGHRRPPHVYADREISDLLQAAAGLAPCSLSGPANAAGLAWFRCTPAPCRHCVITPPAGSAVSACPPAVRRSSAPTAATGSATTPRTARSSCCAVSWAGPRRAAPAPRACMTCGTAWWCAASRPGMPRAPTSTARSRCWHPTSGTWRCVTSTGTCRTSRTTT